MNQIVVGIGHCAVTPDEDSTLVAYGLASCIGIAAWDPAAGVAGLLHYMLPDSAMDLLRSRSNPYLYADTGIPALLDACMRFGARRSRLILRAAGGAQVLGSTDFFNVGQHNHASLRRILANSGLRLHSEMLGGGVSRTMRIEVRSGRCWVEEPGQIQELPGLSLVGGQ